MHMTFTLHSNLLLQSGPLTIKQICRRSYISAGKTASCKETWTVLPGNALQTHLDVMRKSLSDTWVNNKVLNHFYSL